MSKSAETTAIPCQWVRRPGSAIESLGRLTGPSRESSSARSIAERGQRSLSQMSKFSLSGACQDGKRRGRALTGGIGLSQAV